MATLGIRHAVLWVTDPVASADFYTEALGLEVKNAFDGGAFLSSPDSATDHDLGLFRAAEQVGSTTSPVKSELWRTSSRPSSDWPRWVRSWARTTTA